MPIEAADRNVVVTIQLILIKGLKWSTKGGQLSTQSAAKLELGSDQLKKFSPRVLHRKIVSLAGAMFSNSLFYYYLLRFAQRFSSHPAGLRKRPTSFAPVVAISIKYFHYSEIFYD